MIVISSRLVRSASGSSAGAGWLRSTGISTIIAGMCSQHPARTEAPNSEAIDAGPGTMDVLQHNGALASVAGSEFDALGGACTPDDIAFRHLQRNSTLRRSRLGGTGRRLRRGDGRRCSALPIGVEEILRSGRR